jgi:hypothetical protein
MAEMRTRGFEFHAYRGIWFRVGKKEKVTGATTVGDPPNYSPYTQSQTAESEAPPDLGPTAGPFTIARFYSFVRHVLDDHRFVVAHRHLNVASLLKDHTFSRMLADVLEPLPASARSLLASPRHAGTHAHLFSYWEVLLVKA